MHIKALLIVAFPVCQKCKYFFYHMFFKDVIYIYKLMHLPVFIFEHITLLFLTRRWRQTQPDLAPLV